MARFLSEEWFDLQWELAVDLPERPGATARIQHVVTGGPDGEVRHRQVLDDGRIIEAGLGVEPNAEVTLTHPYDDAVAVLKGELDLNAAFMQGRLKVAGDHGKLLSLLPLFDSPPYRAAQATLAEQTEW